MAYPTATLEEVWALFKETGQEIRQLSEEIRQLSQETDRKFRETTQETDRKFQETAQEIRQLSQETDRKFRETTQETDRKLQESIQESNRILKEADRLSRESDKRMERMQTELGRLGNRLGDFVEEMIKPSLVKLFQQRGIIVHKIHRNVEVNNSELKLATQIDLLVVNHEICVLVEVKSQLSIDDVNEHLERMKKFKPLFPEYRDKRVLGAVAGMVIPEDVAKYAYRKGFYIIAQSGDNVVILNDEKFKPVAW